MSSESNVVVVAGDVTMDWNLARTKRSAEGASVWYAGDRTCAAFQPGGVAMLAQLIQAVAAQLQPAGQADEWRVRAPAPVASASPSDDRYNHSYAIWSQHPLSTKPEPEPRRQVWRVEEFLGLDRSRAAAPEGWAAPAGEMDAPAPGIVVLDDADLGFRDRQDRWPTVILEPQSRPWILLKMACPIADGLLWHHLHQHFADRLIVVMTVNDLRLTEVQISRELSWERTAQDLAWELVHNPRVNALADCAHVIASFDTAGAVLLSRQPGEGAPADRARAPTCRLFFDPLVMEGMWAQDYPGGMIGYTSCLAAGVVRQLMLAPDGPDLDLGIQRGLVAMRKLHRKGYRLRDGGADESLMPPDGHLTAEELFDDAPAGRLAFPSERIAAKLAGSKAPFAVAEIQDPVRYLTMTDVRCKRPVVPPSWTILQDRYSAGLDEVAQRIVLDGVAAALQGVPIGQIGNLMTVDRQEIESFRSIRALVGEHFRGRSTKRPLSIAVFGAPGAGKSFAVGEAAQSLLGGQIRKLEFNLSQLNRPEDLHAALHRVRDAVLAGDIPLVFWDEFDTALGGQPLGWLRHFLAPMQDGTFQEGQVTHPVGRALFVFAGGTSTTMDEFIHQLPPDVFRAVKGPDFVSRLKGTIDILGPNPRAGPEADPYHIIRRAILLRAVLKRAAPQLFSQPDGQGKVHLDTGVLRAFLEVPIYKHGARSVDALVAMSLLQGRTRFERSSLPAEGQLDLHVDGRSFLALVQQIVLTDPVLEWLAEAAHEVYRASMRESGAEVPYIDISYGRLPEDVKEQNRDLVRDIPAKLARAGYIMIPARSNEPPFDFPGDDLERLAELEHERWMRLKVGQGWRYGAPRDDAQKLHPDLLPWADLPAEERACRFTEAEDAAIGTAVLPEGEKDKDRDLVRGIPRILARAGYTVVKVRSVEEP